METVNTVKKARKRRAKKIGKVMLRKLYAEIAAGHKRGVIAKNLKLEPGVVSYHRNRYNKGIGKAPKVKKHKTKTYKNSLPSKDVLAKGTSKEKVEALIKYLGTEALKSLLKD